MKLFVIFSFFFFLISPLQANEKKAQTITGVIKYEKETPQGILFIFGRNQGEDGGPPVVVKKVDGPEFPYQFELGPNDVMMRGTKYEGPLRIHAKLSPSGGALDKSGPAGATPKDKSINPGDSDIEIELKAKK